MWIILAIMSAICLGLYDISKKVSLRGNNVLCVLWLNTLFCTLIMLPIIIGGLAKGTIMTNPYAQALMLAKAAIVLSSWILGYYAIKHLPLTIQGPINASRPVIVLIGALCIFGERLNTIQWCGIILGFTSLLLISRIGAKEGESAKSTQWIWMSIGATVLGAISALFDKYLMRMYQPLDVQAWYNVYQLALMSILCGIVLKGELQKGGAFHWRWSILLISIFLTIADVAYFSALRIDGSMIAVVSMIRRGSVAVSFFYGALVLHEKHIKTKIVDLCILLISLILLIIGS